MAAIIRLSLNIAALQMHNFGVFAALYVLGFGFCNGLSYMIPVHHGWLWFPNRPGLISGLIIGGFGLGSLVFSPIATALVNPEGEKAIDGHFSDAVNARVPDMLLFLNLCFAAICVICLILVFPGPDPTELNDALKEKVSNVSRRALSGYDLSVHSQPIGPSGDVETWPIPSSEVESVNNDKEDDIAQET